LSHKLSLQTIVLDWVLAMSTLWTACLLAENIIVISCLLRIL